MDEIRTNIAVTGYYATGSSAVIDLLKEYEKIKVVPDIGMEYEHSVFFVPGGLFELCSKLLHGNSPQGSDMAINDFVDAMKRLNDNNFGWFGSYKKMFGDKFINEVNKFVSNISTTRNSTNSNHTKKVRFSLIKALAQFLYHVIKGRKFNNYGTWYVEDKKKVYFSMPTPEEFFSEAKRFTTNYCNLFPTPTSITHAVFDHLIWPQQVVEYENCFNENFKVIIVERDPRDVYISDQFFRPAFSKAHFPSNINEFVNEWKRTIKATSSSKNILKIKFEDLIYHYDDTINKIEEFIDIDADSHLQKKQFFIPEKSINNTQLFLLNDEWKSIAQQIADELPEMIYSYPSERVPVR